MSKIVAVLLKKLVNKLYLMGVFKVLETKKNNLKDVNVEVGENTSLGNTLLLTTPANSIIILEGNNHLGRDVMIEPDKGKSIRVGNYTSIQDRCILLGDIIIGNYCILAPNIYLSSGTHHFSYKPELYIKDQDWMVSQDSGLSGLSSKQIVIEDDCWLGINVVVMPGVRIGKGSVIGANTVVTKNVEPYSIMAGTPAKLIKKRLEFGAKNALNFDNDNDLPNFYKGFFVNIENLRVDRLNGGVAASKSFTVYLDDVGKKLRLRVKNTTGDKIVLQYGSQKCNLEVGAWNDINFEMEKNNYQHFEIIQSAENNVQKCLLIKSIEVIN